MGAQVSAPTTLYVVEIDGQFFSHGVEDPIVLQGDGDSRPFEAEVNDNCLRAESATTPGAGLFDSPKTAIDSITPAPPCRSNGCHDINNPLETAPRSQLVAQGASTSNCLYTLPFLRASRASHYTIAAVQKDRAAPDPRLERR